MPDGLDPEPSVQRQGLRAGLGQQIQVIEVGATGLFADPPDDRAAVSAATSLGREGRPFMKVRRGSDVWSLTGQHQDNLRL